MKSSRTLLFLTSFALVCAQGVAQTPAAAAAAPAAPAAAKPAAPKVLPMTKIAWVNSSLFLDEQNGIKQLVRSGKELELEFSAQQGDLALQNEKLRTLVGEINKLQAGGATNAEAIQAKQAEGMKLQEELQAKQQAFQAAVQQAQQTKQGPIVAELTKSLDAYAKAHEIGMLFDVAKLGNAVLAAQPELDVTVDFVAEFNASHP
jgi:Skp family chaperone for outer membrane proteins